jgi:hypothetical protein
MHALMGAGSLHRQARAYNGLLTVAYTGTPGGAADAACTGGVQWPVLDDIEVLGVGAINLSSVAVTVRAPRLRLKTLLKQGLHRRSCPRCTAMRRIGLCLYHGLPLAPCNDLVMPGLGDAY